ncbi:MAG: hypothetical protein JHC33_14845 [Ignisphaera sp.]|nr:hypothetical protein [Ignisphaera sp.]
MNGFVHGFRGFKFRVLFYKPGYTPHYAEHVIDPRDGREKLVMADPHNRFSVIVYDISRGVIEEEIQVPGKTLPNPHTAHMLLEDIPAIKAFAGDIICADKDGRWVVIDRDSKKVKWSLYIEDAQWPHDIVPVEDGFIVTDYGSGGFGGFVRRIRFDGSTVWSLPMYGAAKISRVFGSTASGVHTNSFGGRYIVAQNLDTGAVYEVDDDGRIVWRCPKREGEANSVWIFKPHSAFRLGLAEAGGNLTVVGLEAGGGIIALDYFCRPRWGITSLYTHLPLPHYTPTSYGLMETTHVFPTLWGSIAAIDWRGSDGSMVIEVLEIPKTPLAWILALGVDPGNGMWIDPPLEILDKDFVALDIANDGDAMVEWRLYVTRCPAIVSSTEARWRLLEAGTVYPGSVEDVEIDNRRHRYSFARLMLKKIGAGKASASIFVVWV